MLIFNIEKICIWIWAIGNIKLYLSQLMLNYLQWRYVSYFKIIVDLFAVARGIFLSHFATRGGWKEFTLLLPAADGFEKQCLLYFQLSD